MSALKTQHTLLLNLIRHCLPSLASSLLSESMIPQCICEKACNQSLGSSEKGVALLDCIESHFEAEPSDFVKLVDILESEPFLTKLAEKLVKSYCE